MRPHRDVVVAVVRRRQRQVHDRVPRGVGVRRAQHVGVRQVDGALPHARPRRGAAAARADPKRHMHLQRAQPARAQHPRRKLVRSAQRRAGILAPHGVRRRLCGRHIERWLRWRASQRHRDEGLRVGAGVPHMHRGHVA